MMTIVTLTMLLQHRPERPRALDDPDRGERRPLQRLRVVDVRLVLHARHDAVDDPADDELQDPARGSNAPMMIPAHGQDVPADRRRESQPTTAQTTRSAGSGATAVGGGDHRRPILTTDASAARCRAEASGRHGYCASRSWTASARSTPARFSSTRRRRAAGASRLAASHARVASRSSLVRERRGVEADDRGTARSGSVREFQIGSSMSKYGCDELAEQRDARGVLEPERRRPHDRVRQVVAVDERRPRGLLRASRVGMRGLRLRGELAALRGVVGRERRRRSRPAVTTPPAASEIEQLPDEVGVDLEAVEGRSRRRGAGARVVPLRGRRRGAREGRDELELAVAARLGGLRRAAHSASATCSRVAVALLGRDIRVRGELRAGRASCGPSWTRSRLPMLRSTRST